MDPQALTPARAATMPCVADDRPLPRIGAMDMPRMLWIAPLFAAALIAVAARGESPGDWSVHASVRWDLGAVEDVDYIGDTGLLLVLDPAQNPDGSAGFVVWDPATKRVARTILADVAGIVVHTVSADGSRIAGASATAVKVWDATTGEELLVTRVATH